MELLLSYEASCNSTDDKGSSALHLAAWAGHDFILQTLLTQGPSVANVNLTVRISAIVKFLGPGKEVARVTAEPESAIARANRMTFNVMFRVL